MRWLKRRRSSRAFSFAIAIQHAATIIALSQVSPRNDLVRSLPLKPSDVMEFRVVNSETKNGVAGVRVKFNWGVRGKSPDETLTADANGVVTLPLSGKESHNLEVWVFDDRFVSLVARFPAGEARPRRHTYMTKKALPIGGIVVDEQGKPLSGASVLVSPNFKARQEYGNKFGDANRFFKGYLSRKTDADGRWRFPNVPTNVAALEFIVWQPGYWTTTFGHTDVPRNRDQIHIPVEDLISTNAQMVLKEAAPVSGVVLNESETPLKGVRVKCGTNVVVTGLDGRFKFDRWASGSGWIEATIAGYVGQERKLKSTTRAANLTFKLAKGHPLRVRVLGLDDTPVADAQFQLFLRDPNLRQWDAKTDRNGLVVWESAPDKARYSVHKPGYDSFRSYVLVAREKEHVLKISKAPFITGSAVDSDTGEPIAKFTVTWGQYSRRGYTHWVQSSKKSGTAGKFEMRLLSRMGTERAVFKAEAPGYQPAVSDDVPLDETVRVDFKLKRKGR